LLSGAQMYWAGTMATELSDTCQRGLGTLGHSSLQERPPQSSRHMTLEGGEGCATQKDDVS
jgi:hypothetical protein